MNRKYFLTALLLTGLIDPAAAGELEDLLHQVQDTKAREERIDAERKARFLADKNQQQQLLNDTRSALAKAEADSKALRSEFSANEAKITELRTELKKQGGNLNELFAKSREFAGSLIKDVDSSLVSAQYPGRTETLGILVGAREVPNISQLENVWITLLQEMTESGRIAKFQGKYTTRAGEQREAEIYRLGAFTALADDKYLRYSSDTGQLSELTPQPAGEFLGLVKNLREAHDGLIKMAIDPARGAVLEEYVKQAPKTMTWMPKYLRGLLTNSVDFGIIGLLFLASIWAMGVAFERWMFYKRVDILRYGSRVELETDLTRHLTVIGTVAANAPFVGLLGTVVGIMLTFQQMGMDKHMDVHHIMVGLSTALKATAMGLLVAIPCVILNNFLRRRIRELITAYEVRHGS
ncbi:MAG: TonB-system energizer ExbB [Methylococcaceae bacterium]|nr:TonB-system energizer ExbB [Methylococcaceae bacterium]